MLVGMAVVWALRLAGVITNWPMVVLFGVALVVALVAGATEPAPAFRHRRGQRHRHDTTRGDTVGEVGLEWVGVTVPWDSRRAWPRSTPTSSSRP